MKCINKFFISVFLFFGILLSGCKKAETLPVSDFLKEKYVPFTEIGRLYAEDLCVSVRDVTLAAYVDDQEVSAAALYDVGHQKVLYSYNAHERIYPASITKIMTALLALEHGSLSDEVVVGPNAAASSFAIYAQVCGLKEGDVWTLEDLLNALLLYSGNDTATAIAEHIAGSEEAFVQMMNERAKELMANNTHYCNPHGLHEDEHYTTAYDIYLIFQECIKHEEFVDIINQDRCTVTFVRDGIDVERSYKATNWYAQKVVPKPDNVQIFGGKTGTTDEGGYCLILFEKDQVQNPYISIVMGAPVKSQLYQDMTSLIEAIPDV